MKMKSRVIGSVGIIGVLLLVGQFAVWAADISQVPDGPPVEASRYNVPAANLAEVQSAGPLTFSLPGGIAHIFPTARSASALAAQGLDSGPLLYHAGGAIMGPQVVMLAIVWAPPTLQDGSTTGFSGQYMPVQLKVMQYYGAKGLGANSTQYYQTISGVTSYITNFDYAVGVYLDNSPYPASGCTDAATPGDCITDAQIQAEITKVMGLRGWTAGPNTLFVLFTSRGEGSCMDSTNASCAYVQYCAYHGVSGSPSMIYANIPYGDTTVCQLSGTPSPNGDADADAASTALSHEMTEAITDPLLNAWYTAAGNEIGDLCAYVYGTNGWDSGLANQMWNGTFFELQEEFDNHASACVQVGP